MDLEKQSTQIIIGSVSLFLFIIIIVTIYRLNRKCNRSNRNNKSNRNNRNNKSNRNKETYQEIENGDKEFLDKNIYQNTGLGIKDYNYLSNNQTWGQWSWDSNPYQNFKGDCNYSTSQAQFKERNINNF